MINVPFFPLMSGFSLLFRLKGAHFPQLLRFPADVAVEGETFVVITKVRARLMWYDVVIVWCEGCLRV